MNTNINSLIDGNNYEEKYCKYKQKYLNLKNSIGQELGQNGGLCKNNLINNQILNLLDSHRLVGIGDFTHGCKDTWDFIIGLLEYLILNTDKPIKLFTENSAHKCKAIMTHKKIKYFKPFMYEGRFPTGKLGIYSGYTSESPEFFQLIKFIRKYKNRIEIIGTDNDTIDRDKSMSIKILNNLHEKNLGYNIWFGSNHHIDTSKYNLMNQKWVSNPHIQRYFAGHYLKKKLANEYCIILSQGYEGTIRFNGVCIGDDCEYRIANLDYIWKDFKIPQYKKYLNKKDPITLYNNKEFQTNSMVIFNAVYHASLDKEKPIGLSGGLYCKNTHNWDFILFFNKVHKLEQLK